jgi:DNA replication protein DnaC
METESLIITRDSQTKTCDICGANIIAQRIDIWGVVKYFFPICKCEAAELKEKDEKEKADARKRKLDSLFKQSRLGERFRGCTFENYPRIPETRDIYNHLFVYSEFFKYFRNKSILLLSHPGTGKTYLAASAVNMLVEKGVAAVFVVVPDLLNRIRSTYGKDNQDTENQIMYGLCEADLLVLDDLGAERHKDKDDWGTEKLYSIINSRYNNMSATIFTTNCTMKELADKLGDRTFSRICEMTEGFRFDLNHVMDFRMKSFYRK